MNRMLPMLVSIIVIGCAQAIVRTPEQDRWSELRSQYETIESVRASSPIPAAGRREQIAALLERQKRLEPIYVPFMATLRSYVEESADARARALYARERILMGDEYAHYLARYDRAISLYRSALELDPGNAAIEERIAAAEDRLYLSPRKFGDIQPSMSQADVVSIVGYPRIDWVRETVRDGRTYTVWIYPKADGGAAAVYFDNGILYHKNWDAAPADSNGA